MPRGAKSGPANPQWKGDAAHRNTKRERTQKLFRLRPCEHCGVQATDRHHIDDDTGNNHPNNIMILCRRCHMIEDGRLENLRKNAPTPLPPRPCANCDRMVTRFWHGECETCYAFRRRTGKKRPPVMVSLRQVRAASHAAEPCSQCGRPKNWGSRGCKGMCGSCYQISWQEIRAIMDKGNP